jgi:hypothetical protein
LASSRLMQPTSTTISSIEPAGSPLPPLPIGFAPPRRHHPGRVKRRPAPRACNPPGRMARTTGPAPLTTLAVHDTEVTRPPRSPYSPALGTETGPESSCITNGPRFLQDRFSEEGRPARDSLPRPGTYPRRLAGLPAPQLPRLAGRPVGLPGPSRVTGRTPAPVAASPQEPLGGETALRD